MAMTFDLAPNFKEIKDLFFAILRQPFELWYLVPVKIKLAIVAVIIILTIIFAVLVWKNKYTWRHKSF